MRAQRELERRFSAEPSRGPDQAANEIACTLPTPLVFPTMRALLGNAILLPTAFWVLRRTDDVVVLAAVGLFVAVGVVLAISAIRAWRVVLRFRRATLSLQEMPVTLGSRVLGKVTFLAGVPMESELEIRLRCVDQRQGKSGPVERTRWQAEQNVPGHERNSTSAASSVRVDIAVPIDQPATRGDWSTSRDIVWYLDVIGTTARGTFWTCFELPVVARTPA